MGMLFNTPDTLDMIRRTHEAFSTNWATFQGNTAQWEPVFRALGTGGVGSTYATLSGPPLNLTHPTKNARWQAWLGILDTAGVSTTIGGYIADAIINSGKTFSGIEFHLVPDVHMTATQADLPDQNPTRVPNTAHSKVIVINTVTWDNLHP